MPLHQRLKTPHYSIRIYPEERIKTMDTTAQKNQQFFESLLIVYANSCPHTVKNTLGQFKAVGLNNTITLSSPDEWEDTLNDGSVVPDLIIIDRDFFGEESEAKIKALRHGKVGSNPFVPTIGTIGEAKRSEVLSFTRSGIDEILIRPFAIATILQRLSNFARGRKPFIATADYIGPDRRTRQERMARNDGESSEESPERLIKPQPVDVPNPLQLKAEKIYNYKDFMEMTDRAQQEVYKEILRGSVFRLIFDSVILSETASYNLSTEIIKKHADDISENLSLISTMAQEANLMDARFMRNLDNVRRTYKSGVSENGFDLGVTASLIDAATELALLVYQQSTPYRIIAEIRESAQSFMTKSYRDQDTEEAD